MLNGKVKIILRRCMCSINFADPANIRMVHKDVIRQVRNEAIHIRINAKFKSNLYHLNGTSSFQL